MIFSIQIVIIFCQTITVDTLQQMNNVTTFLCHFLEVTLTVDTVVSLTVFPINNSCTHINLWAASLKPLKIDNHIKS